MTVSVLIRLLLFAVAMALPIMAVQMVTFYLMRKYAATIAASLERLTQLVGAHEEHIVQIARSLESTSANLLLVADRLGPPESA